MKTESERREHRAFLLVVAVCIAPVVAVVTVVVVTLQVIAVVSGRV